MTTIINHYIGIIHPLPEKLIENEVFCQSWKHTNCSNGVHAFNEVFTEDIHCLHCDICGIDIHISKIVIPDGKDKVIGENRSKV